MANLINAGIVPMTFANEADYDRIDQDDELKIENIGGQIAGGNKVKVTNVTKGFDFECDVNFSDRQKDMLYAGGLLNYTKNKS
jgi:aconitate hydratase